MDSETIVVAFVALSMFTMATLAAGFLALMLAPTAAHRTKTAYAAIGGAGMMAVFAAIVMLFSEGISGSGAILGLAVVVIIAGIFPCWPVAYFAFRRIAKVAIIDASAFE